MTSIEFKTAIIFRRSKTNLVKKMMLVKFYDIETECCMYMRIGMKSEGKKVRKREQERERIDARSDYSEHL